MTELNRLAIAIAAIIVLAGPVLAQHMPSHHDHRMANEHLSPAMSDMDNPERALTEPGQGAFAAISEAVAKLDGDPQTDWISVDVAALRDHLIDMDRVVRDTTVAVTERADGASFGIDGDQRAREAAGRMVPAHIAVLEKTRPWSFTLSREKEALRLDVAATTPGEAQKIKALGFYGIMALDDHHRAHHWAMVNGRPMH